MSANQPEGDADSRERALVTAALDDEIAQWPAPRGEVMRAMNALCDRLGEHLMRWLGPGGWQALLGRAFADAKRKGVPAALMLTAEFELRWIDDASLARARDACIEVLIAVLHVLARFIGTGMALRLVELGLASGDDQDGGTDDG